MDHIRLAVDMLHYNVPAADKAAQPYQDSFARLVKAHFGAGLRPEIGKVVLGVTNLPADMDAYLQAAEAIESELARSLKVPVLAVNSPPDGPSALADLSKKLTTWWRSSEEEEAVPAQPEEGAGAAIPAAGEVHHHPPQQQSAPVAGLPMSNAGTVESMGTCLLYTSPSPRDS